MGTEGQDGAAGKHIHVFFHDTAQGTDDIRTVLREGVDLVLAASLDREQLSDLVTSLREELSRDTPVENAPAVQAIPGLEDWAQKN